MVERKLLVDRYKITYDGLLDFNSLYKTIRQWFFDKGFDRNDKKSEEIHHPEGTSVYIDMRPWKKLSKYVRQHYRLQIFADRLKSVEVEREGVKQTLNQGKIQIFIDVYHDTDWLNQWDGIPFFYFLRTLYDKYIFKYMNESTEKGIMADFNHLTLHIQSYLNIYQTEGKFKPQWG